MYEKTTLTKGKPMAIDLLHLIETLDLEDGPAEATYTGRNLDIAYPRVFGGQILGQGVRALDRAVPNMTVKSLTQYFPREGDGSIPMEYAVDTVHRGRSFATCVVTGSQQGQRTSLMTASMHVAERGFSHSVPPPPVASPEEATLVDLRIVPWETKFLDGTDLDARDARPARLRFWMRAPGLAEVADVEQSWLHQALLAHASEPTVIGTALLPVKGWSQADAHRRFTSAVTSHAVWFHAHFRLDEWLLVEQVGPVLEGGRGFGRADVWDRRGKLVASWAQESLVRPHE